MPLHDAGQINGLYRIENVDTEAAERITANDEERQRQAFELQTVFEWGIHHGQVNVSTVLASDAEGDILTLRHGPGATITRINKGLRRRRTQPVRLLHQPAHRLVGQRGSGRQRY
ncbi:hypothetical protein [Rhodanobacter lindaniclasticus]